ncbi:MAG: hypothetical protein DMG89_06170 [Acidobacteria bacterium]|nr:MAG: hypothetical protein DMG89_06170 [Acidobacteriota bacterium]
METTAEVLNHHLKCLAERDLSYASSGDKVRRLLGRGKSEKEAEELVDNVNRERADFIQKYFNAEWPDRRSITAS